jgi:Transposase DDE domain group 1
MRLAADQQAAMACNLVRALAGRIGPKLAEEILGAMQRTDSEIVAQRGRIDELRRALDDPTDGPAQNLLAVAEYPVRWSLWILRHLVLDAEVYSGGQSLLRADSGFAREALMSWCDANGVDYLFGLAKNQRLVAAIASELAGAEEDSKARGEPARRFTELLWSMHDS